MEFLINSKKKSLRNYTGKLNSHSPWISTNDTLSRKVKSLPIQWLWELIHLSWPFTWWTIPIFPSCVCVFNRLLRKFFSLIFWYKKMKSELRMLCMTFLLKKAVYLLGPKTEMSVPRSIVCFVVHLSKSEKKIVEPIWKGKPLI